MNRDVAGLLLAAGLLTPLYAAAQSPFCATPAATRAAAGGQTAGSPCRCQANPTVRGQVVILSDQGALADRERPRRRELSNDDLEDGDDVLAGPRHHERREREQADGDN